MKKSKVIILLIVLMFALSVIFPLVINARDMYQVSPYLYEPALEDETEAQDMYGFIGIAAGAIKNIGIIVSIGALMIIGIRYIVASAEEKAEYKERMLPYVIGCVLLFGASNVVGMINKMFNPLSETPYAYLDENYDPEKFAYMYLHCANEGCRQYDGNGMLVSVEFAEIPTHYSVYCDQCGELLFREGRKEPEPEPGVAMFVLYRDGEFDNDFVDWYNEAHNIDWYFEYKESSKNKEE